MNGQRGSDDVGGVLGVALLALLVLIVLFVSTPRPSTMSTAAAWRRPRHRPTRSSATRQHPPRHRDEGGDGRRPDRRGLPLGAFLVYSHASITVAQTSAPHAVATVASTPTPDPPDPFAPARWAAANVALIALMLAIGIGVPVGIALHAWHRGRLLELEHPPLRVPELTHRAYDVKALEARRGWFSESFTYSPHMRNDAAVIEEEEPLALPGPVLTAQQALDMPGIVYGQRLDTGEPLIEQRVLSLAIGGRPGSGKTSTALLLAAQYSRLGAELRVADPHSGHPGSLLTQLEPLVSRSALGWVAETPRETLMLVDQVAGSWSAGRPAGAVTTAIASRWWCSSTSSRSRCACCRHTTVTGCSTRSRCWAMAVASTASAVSCWHRAGWSGRSARQGYAIR